MYGIIKEQTVLGAHCEMHKTKKQMSFVLHKEDPYAAPYIINDILDFHGKGEGEMAISNMSSVS